MARADDGDLAGAEELLERALALDPAAGMPRILMAWIAEQRGELAKARAWLDQAIYVAPADAEVRRHAAAAFDRLGLPVEAAAERRAAAAAERAT